MSLPNTYYKVLDILKGHVTEAKNLLAEFNGYISEEGLLKKANEFINSLIDEQIKTDHDKCRVYEKLNNATIDCVYDYKIKKSISIENETNYSKGITLASSLLLPYCEDKTKETSSLVQKSPLKTYLNAYVYDYLVRLRQQLKVLKDDVPTYRLLFGEHDSEGKNFVLDNNKTIEELTEHINRVAVNCSNKEIELGVVPRDLVVQALHTRYSRNNVTAIEPVIMTSPVRKK